MADQDTGLSTGRARIADLFQNHRRRVIVGLVVVMFGLGIGAVLAILNLSDTGRPGPTAGHPGPGSAPVQEYEFLPDTKRELDEEDDAAVLARIRDPFSAPLALTGVVLGGRGADLAVIQAGGAAYVVTAGEPVAGVWTVAEIRPDSVLLTADGRELLLELGAKR